MVGVKAAAVVVVVLSSVALVAVVSAVVVVLAAAVRCLSGLVGSAMALHRMATASDIGLCQECLNSLLDVTRVLMGRCHRRVVE